MSKMERFDVPKGNGNGNALAKIGIARRALAEATTVPAKKELRDQFKTVAEYLKERGESFEKLFPFCVLKLDAERQIGELSVRQPRDQGARSDITLSNVGQSYQDWLDQNGLTRQQASRWEVEASVPDDEYRARLEELREKEAEPTSTWLQGLVSKAHVSQNSGISEWYTPPEYIAAAREVMGEIDLDPASCDRANEIVKARVFYSLEDDGLTKEWRGRVWMNPPYSNPPIGDFCEKFAASCESGDVTEGIVLVNNATETEWFERLVSVSTALVFPRGRVKFLDPQGNPGAPLQGQACIYFGKQPQKFLGAFGKFGWEATR